MPALLILGPLFGLAALLMMTHAQKAPAALAGPKGAVPFGATRQIELDHGMPEGVVHQVLTALVHGQDAGQLETLAGSLGPHYPLAASELRAKAATLTPTAKEPPRAGPDTSDAAVILQAAMRALTEETDPVSLEGFAESIRAKYPTATVLLLGRARDLRAAAASPPPTPAAAPSLPSPGAMPLASAPLPLPISAPPPPLPPPSTATYHVQPGDTPSRIAEKLGHGGAAWPELVAANPTKPTTADGSFVSLHAGEALALPASWATVAATHPATHGTEVRS